MSNNKRQPDVWGTLTKVTTKNGRFGAGKVTYTINNGDTKQWDVPDTDIAIAVRNALMTGRQFKAWSFTEDKIHTWIEVIYTDNVEQGVFIDANDDDSFSIRTSNTKSTFNMLFE